MNNYRSVILLLLKRLLLIFALYQLSRLVFYFWNHSSFSTAGLMEFIGGVRFDLSAIFYINSVFIIAHLIPGNFKYGKTYQKILKILFFSVNLIFLATNFIDVPYYNFTSRRSTLALITASGMQQDVIRLIPAFAKDYWMLVVGFVILAIVFWKLIPNFKTKQDSKPDYKSPIPWLIFLISIPVILIIGRGGLQRVPLKIVHAVQYTKNPNYTALVLNTPFSILKTISKNDNLKELHYFSDEEVAGIFQPVIELKNDDEFEKKNVVLIIIESMGEENLFLDFDGKKLTPFLDSLTQNSLYFKRAYANGRKSIDAVPSTITSIPYLMEISYISSPYSFNEIDGFSKVLKQKGYYTSFFHGSFNGSQNFDKFAAIADFDDYFGKEQYDRPGDYDGYWGIFDEEFLQFTNRKFKTFKSPFFATIFTISSHNPYTVPEKYKGKFPKGNRIIHESIAYTDYSLKKFFEAAKKEDWYQNTVFIITPDHTSGDDKTDPYYTSAMGNYKIPLMIIDPSRPEINSVNQKLIQQIDIMPEVLDYLNYSGKIFSFGNHPEKINDRMVADFNEGLYHFIIDNYYVCFDGKSVVRVCDIVKDPLLKTNLTDYPKNLQIKIEAYIQQYNNRIIKNRTTLESIEKGADHTK